MTRLGSDRRLCKHSPSVSLPLGRVEFVRDAEQRRASRDSIREDIHNRFLTDVIFHRLSLLIIHFKESVRLGRTHVNDPPASRGSDHHNHYFMTTVMKREKNNESNGGLMDGLTLSITSE